MQSIQNPWVLTPDEVLNATGGSFGGLAATSVRQRLMDCGPNTLRAKDVEPWYMLFLEQFANPLVYMLIGAAGAGRLSAGSQQGFPHPAADGDRIGLGVAPRCNPNSIGERAKEYRPPILCSWAVEPPAVKW
jgi:hypothetical protein